MVAGAEAPVPEDQVAEEPRPATAPPPVADQAPHDAEVSEEQRPATACSKPRKKVQCGINVCLTSATPVRGDAARSHHLSKKISTRYAEEVKAAENLRRSKFVSLAEVNRGQPQKEPDAREVVREFVRDLDDVQKSQVLGSGAYDALVESDGFQKKLQYLRDHAQTGSSVEKYGDDGQYEGEFLHGMRHGKGRHTWRSQGQGNAEMCDEYDGEWKWDKRHGKGVLKKGDGSHCVGEWQDGKEHGFCTIKNAGGIVVFQGDYRNGKRNGVGRQLFENGDIYDGGWSDGKLSDRGTYFFSNGDKLYGHWEKGKYHGVGHFHHADGSVSRRHYNNGVLQDAQDGAKAEAEVHSPLRFGKSLQRKHMQKQTLNADFPLQNFRPP